jgi:putative hydrolase of HD superfamily
MKTIPRSGWISHGVGLQDVESIADHSFSTCALALVLADLETKRGRRVDMERVLRLAVLHDMSESLTFDISKGYLQYLGQRGRVIKKELDRSAWNHLADDIENPSLRREYTRLQAEFVAEKTIESKIVHAADSLDILLQVIEYRRRGYHEILLADLWDATNTRLGKVNIPSVREVQRMIVKEAKRTNNGKVK